MIPYNSHRLSAVPKTLAARLEIMKAIRTFATHDENEQLRQRRAEIAAIRRDLEDVGQSLREACRDWALLARSHLEKFAPNQPRVPAGNPDGGRWTGEENSGSSRGATATSGNPPQHPSPRSIALDTRPAVRETDRPNSDAGQGTNPTKTPALAQTKQFAARRISPALLAECAEQYELDLVECRMAASPACYAQALLRRSNCERGLQIPPLNY